MTPRTAFPLVRDVDALRRGRFDLLVIGGGIYGAWTACDAAQRGLSVALVEKNDWGSGTSSASSKLIHGGLRYLEHFEFRLVRQALLERRVLTRIAPHLVRPLRFVVPVWAGARVGVFRLSAGLTLYDFLAGGNQPVERHRSFSARRLLARHPYLRAEGLKGGLSYGDCQEDDARMTLAVVAGAQRAGAVVANKVAAERLERDVDGRHRVSLRDNADGGVFEVSAGCVVAAAGPWTRALLRESSPRVKLVKGVHLVMPAIPDCDEAFLFTAPQDGRVYFVMPWYGRTLVGTTEAEVGDPAEARVEPDEVRYLLDAVRAALPRLGWTERQVIGSFAGVRTLQAANETSLSAVTREFEVVQPAPGLVVPVGGKFTTSRGDAVEIVDAVLRALGRAPVESGTHRLPLPGAPDAGGFAQWHIDALRRLTGAGVDAEAAALVALRHGTRVDRLLELCAESPQWRARLHPQIPFLRAEAVLAARDEMARSLADVLRRRMPLSLLVGLERSVVADAAELLGAELGWDADARQQAVDEFLG